MNNLSPLVSEKNYMPNKMALIKTSIKIHNITDDGPKLVNFKRMAKLNKPLSKLWVPSQRAKCSLCNHIYITRKWLVAENWDNVKTFYCFDVHCSPPTTQTRTQLFRFKLAETSSHTLRPQRNFLRSYKSDNGTCPGGSGKSEVTYEHRIPLMDAINHKSTIIWDNI